MAVLTQCYHMHNVRWFRAGMAGWTRAGGNYTPESGPCDLVGYVTCRYGLIVVAVAVRQFDITCHYRLQ